MNARNSSIDQRVIWIGLVQVKPKPGNAMLGDAVGAFAPAAGFAANVDEFASVVATHLDELGFEVEQVEDIQEFARGRETLDEGLVTLAETLTNENPIAMGTFHTYKADPTAS